jgi:hypothetical protein
VIPAYELGCEGLYFVVSFEASYLDFTRSGEIQPGETANDYLGFSFLQTNNLIAMGWQELLWKAGLKLS